MCQTIYVHFGRLNCMQKLNHKLFVNYRRVVIENFVCVCVCVCVCALRTIFCEAAFAIGLEDIWCQLVTLDRSTGNYDEHARR